jgi:hypothetical protein
MYKLFIIQFVNIKLQYQQSGMVLIQPNRLHHILIIATVIQR